MTTENAVTFDVDFTPFGTFVPYQGEGASDRVEKDGFYAIKLRSLKPYMTKGKDGAVPKPSCKLASNIQDEDAKGANIIDDVLCGGKDKNGDDLGRQLMELICSTGKMTAENIQAMAKAGQKLNIQKVCQNLDGAIAYVELQAALTQDGRETSEIKSYVSKEKYDQAVSLKAHRRNRRAVVAGANAAAAQGFNLGGAPGAGAPAGNFPFGASPNGATPTPNGQQPAAPAQPGPGAPGWT